MVDTGNYRILKFNSSGTYVSQWGTNGSGASQFNAPQGATVDTANNVYVADTYNNRIQKFDAYGNYITQWGSYGQGEGRFSYPIGIA